jgi:hypothetical protein
MATQAQDPFWSDFVIPFQEEEGDFEFANPIQVQRHFLKATAHAAYLAEQAERESEQMANLEVQKARAERELLKLRRALLASAYSGITKSAGTEIQDAYLLKVARDEGREEDMLRWEGEVEDLLRKLEVRRPRLDKLRHRLKLLEKKADWAKQFLDYEKMLQRIESSGRYA